MIPIVKAWCTDTAIDIASLGVQVHGGMGFIEETGAAQLPARRAHHHRSTRAPTASRRPTSSAARSRATAARPSAGSSPRCARSRPQLEQEKSETLSAIAARLRDGIAALEQAVQFVVATYGADIRKASVGAVPFLELFGTVAGGWQSARAALVAHRRLAAGAGEAGFYRAKLATARFYADHVLVRAPGLARTVVAGADAVLAIEDDQF